MTRRGGGGGGGGGGEGGGGGLGYYLIEAIYLYSYVLPHRVGFLCRFGLKSDIVFEG